MSEKGRSFVAAFLAFGAALSGQTRAEEKDSTPTPQRIVAIAPNTAEMICAIGACDRIVGVSKFCVFPPELKTRVRIGGLYDPDLEGIIALRPDLLATRGHHDALERLAEQLKIPIYYDQTDSLEGIVKSVRELGELLGASREADAAARAFSARIDKIRKDSEGVRKIRVLLTVSRSPQRLANILTAGRGTFLTEMIELAGGVNVFGDLDMRYPEVSVESIITRQPECIIELMPEVDVVASDVMLREQWKQYPMVPAVKNNCLHFVSAENALIPSLRYADFIEQIAALLHASGNSK